MSTESTSAVLPCPKCAKAMHRIEFESVAVDRCESCGGLWFDLLEHRHLRDEFPNADALDTRPAPPISEEDQNKAPLLGCPRCRVQMTRLKDTDRRDVIYDYCAVCKGTFFEAGEFRRYARKGLLGRLFS